MLELHHANTSVCAQKVRIMLAEKGLDWTGHTIDIRRGEQFDPAYLKLNPKAVVPTLVHDGAVIIESSVIDEYLDDAFAAPPLKPNDPLSRARMRLWVKAVDEGLHQAVATLSFSIVLREQLLEMPAADLERHLENIPDPTRRERQRTAIELGLESPALVAALNAWDGLLGDLETELTARGPWAAGADFSLADIALTPYVTRLDQLQMASLWADRPGMADWFARVRERASYTAITDFAPDGYVSRLKERGADAWPVLRRRMVA